MDTPEHTDTVDCPCGPTVLQSVEDADGNVTMAPVHQSSGALLLDDTEDSIPSRSEVEAAAVITPREQRFRDTIDQLTTEDSELFRNLIAELLEMKPIHADDLIPVIVDGVEVGRVNPRPKMGRLPTVRSYFPAIPQGMLGKAGEHWGGEATPEESGKRYRLAPGETLDDSEDDENHQHGEDEPCAFCDGRKAGYNDHKAGTAEASANPYQEPAAGDPYEPSDFQMWQIGYDLGALDSKNEEVAKYEEAVAKLAEAEGDPTQNQVPTRPLDEAVAEIERDE